MFGGGGVQQNPPRVVIADTFDGHAHAPTAFSGGANLFDARTLIPLIVRDPTVFKLSLAQTLGYSASAATEHAKQWWAQTDLQIDYVASYVGNPAPPELIKSLNHLFTQLRISMVNNPGAVQKKLQSFVSASDPLGGLLAQHQQQQQQTHRVTEGSRRQQPPRGSSPAKKTKLRPAARRLRETGGAAPVRTRGNRN